MRFKREDEWSVDVFGGFQISKVAGWTSETNKYTLDKNISETNKYTNTNTQIHKYTNTQIHKYTNTKTHK